MAVKSYDVLSALNRMLESDEARERFKMSNALAMMQFAQQKRMQDVQLAGQQLQFLQEANKQAMVSQATEFMTDVGFGGMDLEDTDAYDKQKKILTDDIDIDDGVNVGGYGMDAVTAARVLSAVHAAQKGNPQAILNIADSLNKTLSKSKTGAKISEQDKLVLKSFQATGYFTDKAAAQKKLASISRTIQNISDVTTEMYEFGQGDYAIDRDIGIYEPQLAKPEDGASKSLESLSNSLNNLTTIKSSEAGDLAGSLQLAIEAKENYNREIEALESIKAEQDRTGKKLLSDVQLQLLVDRGESEGLLDDRIKLLSEDFGKKRSELAAVTAVDVHRKTRGVGGDYDPGGMFGNIFREKYDTVESLTDLFTDVDPDVLEMIRKGQPGAISDETTAGEWTQYLLTAPKDIPKGKISDLEGGKQLDLMMLGKMIQERRDVQNITLSETDKEKEYYKLFPEMRGK